MHLSLFPPSVYPVQIKPSIPDRINAQLPVPEIGITPLVHLAALHKVPVSIHNPSFYLNYYYHYRCFIGGFSRTVSIITLFPPSRTGTPETDPRNASLSSQISCGTSQSQNLPIHTTPRCSQITHPHQHKPSLPDAAWPSTS